MVFCTKCGTQLPDGSTFCSACGTPLASQAPQQPAYQQPQQPAYQQPQQPAYQQPQQPVYQQPQQPVYQQPMQQALPMNWYKFLIYFALFAGAVLNLVTGIMMITGGMYDGMASLVYATFDGLQVLDMAMGILIFAMVGLAVFTRFRLSGFCKNGPMLLMLTYASTLVFYIAYLIGLACILPSELIGEMAATFVGSMVGSGVMLVVNWIYFNKRKHLFVN